MIGSRPVGCARALLLLALVLLSAGCGKQSRDWRRQLRSPDAFERFVAALALCEAHPRQAAPALRVLFVELESDVPRNRAAAGRALESMTEHKLATLIDFLVVAGPTRPLVRTRITPLVRAAGPRAGELLLDSLRRNDWSAPPEAFELLLELARSEPDIAMQLAAELDKLQDEAAGRVALEALIGELP